MIQLKQVVKRMNKDVILDKMSLNIQKGSIYGLLGSNGAGKTTILKLLAGIYKQNEGTVTVEEQAVFENSKLKSRMFFIADYPSFLPHYTTKQMALFYKELYPSWNGELFKKIGKQLDINENKKIHHFSKGVQRQIAFWLAFATEPEYLILDEPFDGLDPVIRSNVKKLIVQQVAEREMTVIISSHNLSEVEDLCDHISIIHKGKCLIENDIDEIKLDFHKIQVAFPEANTIEQLKKSLSMVHFEQRGSVSMFIVKGEKDDIIKQIDQFNPLLLDILALTLEEIFIYQMEELDYAIKENLLL
ncbi:ABC transporter ATP-binding protein [Niallia taxi]|uniref:ABC transporter ATP-binding protein n=1 Tax=Niallia taxi TaxID=2499688 RepID=A0A437K5L1_9BACI|nr:ABC transporter ATP-binding protein [Niallia taxi]RVT58325.1 ABC transporter ATP-binding protein [Niallia taxi]